MNNGYFQSPCRKRVKTRPEDLDAQDFDLAASAVPGVDPGTFDITTVLSPKPYFGDVQGFASGGNATLFDAADAETPAGTAAGPLNSGVPGALSVVFTGVAQTPANVGNVWKLVIANLEVTAKDGQTFNIPALSKTFPSPL